MAKSWYKGKHYYGESFFDSGRKLDNQVVVRMSDEEIVILNNFFPGQSMSYAIRSIIHKYAEEHS